MKLNSILVKKSLPSCLFYSQISSGLSSHEIHTLRAEFQNIFCDDLYHAPYTNVRELIESQASCQLGLALLVRLSKAAVKNFYRKADYHLSKVWLVQSTAENNRGDVVPHVAHFDRERYLKVMFYLDDVSCYDGPIHLLFYPDSVSIETRRLKLRDDYKEKRLNVIDMNDCIGAPMPMTGMSGDMIIFDTNMIHFAGQVQPGHRRRVVRLDFSIKS